MHPKPEVLRITSYSFKSWLNATSMLWVKVNPVIVPNSTQRNTGMSWRYSPTGGSHPRNCQTHNPSILCYPWSFFFPAAPTDLEWWYTRTFLLLSDHGPLACSLIVHTHRLLLPQIFIGLTLLASIYVMICLLLWFCTVLSTMGSWYFLGPWVLLWYK